MKLAANRQNRRVVITGIGMVSPLGVGVERTWKGVVAGQSGIGPITRFDASQLPTRIAGEVDDAWLRDAAPDLPGKKMGRFTHLGMIAAREAWADSGLAPTDEERDDLAVIVGSAMGGINEIEEQMELAQARGLRAVSPYFHLKWLLNLLAGEISIELGLRGPNICPVTACASGAHAIGQAAGMIARGEHHAALAGAADAAIGYLAIAGFASAKALSRRNDEPEKASRPFDRARDGFVVGEGGCIVVLEEFEHARRRGATIYAQVAGFGASGDAFHHVRPPDGGAGALLAVRRAVESAGVDPSAVEYVSAHGTSTPVGDREEMAAMTAAFGPRGVIVSSAKSMIGHLLGAAGSIETAFCALSLRDGVCTPTINLDDPDCGDFDFVPHAAIEKEMKVVLSNSFGFGGTNSAVLLRRV